MTICAVFGVVQGPCGECRLPQAGDALQKDEVQPGKRVLGCMVAVFLGFIATFRVARLTLQTRVTVDLPECEELE